VVVEMASVFFVSLFQPQNDFFIPDFEVEIIKNSILVCYGRYLCTSPDVLPSEARQNNLRMKYNTPPVPGQ